MLKKFVLSNGLRLLLFPMKNTKAVTALYLAQTGSKYETKTQNGISHLLEHLVFRGTKNWPEPSSIARELDSVGGFYNAFTDKEMLGIWTKVEVKHLPLALNIIADMVINPLFPEQEIPKEKKVVIEEINMREDNSQIAVLDLWEELLYGDQPAGWQVIGTKQTVMAINQKGLFSHLKDSFSAKKSIVVLAGGFSEKSVKKEIEKSFSPLGRGSGSSKLPAKEKQADPQVILRFKETDQTHLCLGVRTFGALSKKRYSLALLATILGGMMSSRLFEEIREKRGLAYYVRALTEYYTDTGYLVAHAGLNNDKVSEAIDIICREYKKLAAEPVNIQELKKAKEHLKGSLFLGLETSDELASFFGLQEIMGKKPLVPEQEWQEIAKITPDDILKVAGEIFHSDRLNLAIIGPHKDREKFLSVLKI
ncbi:MAG: pitrilysin family protein [bacterium]|nr:pitrilysin family protein [bacterium]